MVLPLAILLAVSVLLLAALALKCRTARKELDRLSAHAAAAHSENARLAGQLGSLLVQLEELQRRVATGSIDDDE